MNLGQSWLSAVESLAVRSKNVTEIMRTMDPSHDTPIALFLSSVYTQMLSGICALFACLITFHHIYCHLKNYTCVVEQRYIIRILFIIPAFAIYAFSSIMLAVHARMNSVFIEPVHDIAEALAIYSFLALCYQYLGGEGNIMLELFGKTIKPSILYGTCCFAGKPYTILFLRFCKVATLQYTLIKPFTSALSIVLTSLHKYSVGNFSLTSGYLYLFLINNFTVTLALYGLLLFYFATRDQLRPFKPILKFATIKAIIFFSFWQDVLFSILEWTHVVNSSGDYPAGLIAAGCKNVLICIELIFTAVALRYAFPYSIYVLNQPPRLVLDIPPDGQDWPEFPPKYEFKSDPTRESANLSTEKWQVLRTDLLFGTTGFGNRLPNYQSSEPLPWEVAESKAVPEEFDERAWIGRTSAAIPSISASIKATMDPRDIFVDAVHNFHPTYRHYTQTKLDDSA